MKLSGTQREIIQHCYDQSKAMGFVGKLVPQKIWTKMMKDSGARTPKKLLEPYITDDGSIDFTELFKFVVGLNFFADSIDEAEVLESESEDECPAVDTVENIKDIDPVIPKDMVEPETDTYMQRLLATKQRKRKMIGPQGNPVFKNPIYTVEVIDCTDESSIIACAKDFETAFNLKELAIHDQGKIAFEAAADLIEKHCHIIIESAVSKTLRCRIRKIELY